MQCGTIECHACDGVEKPLAAKQKRTPAQNFRVKKYTPAQYILSRKPNIEQYFEASPFEKNKKKKKKKKKRIGAKSGSKTIGRVWSKPWCAYSSQPNIL